MYLASMNSRAFSPPRHCIVEGVVMFGTGKKALLVRLEPPGPGADFGLPGLLERVVVSPRLEGCSVDPVSEYPCHVHIAVRRDGKALGSGPIHADDLVSVAWGELYESERQALDWQG